MRPHLPEKTASNSALGRPDTVGESMGDTLGVGPCDWLGLSGGDAPAFPPPDGTAPPGCRIQYVKPCARTRHP